MQVQNTLALDGLEKIKHAARDQSPGATKAVATQFEALFLNMVLKSMREASPAEGLLDSEQSRNLTSMLDQQMAQTLATRGVGLAKLLTQQLSAQPQVAAPPTDKTQFSTQLMPHAEAASAATGIPARFMLAQAALESGWGQHVMRMPDGSSSHNLFGLKAGSDWKGKVVEGITTEFVDGVAHKVVQKFRAYDTPAQAFADYAALLSGSPRYRSLLTPEIDAAGFAYGLQRAGYATDPRYAEKLLRVMDAALT